MAQRGDADGVVRQLRAIMPSFEPANADATPIVHAPSLRLVQPARPSREDAGPGLNVAVAAEAEA